ncbi:MAG TPA: hypothetical protein VJ602_00335 [Paludibacter sp.]|nr:hypothetical protein [Paludibacter sp.]
MFENGLLATFIPEVLMVIGFILCLLTPGFKAAGSGTEQAPVVAHISTYEHRQTATYHVSTYDFQLIAEAVPEARYSLPRFIEKTTFPRFEFRFSTSAGLSFVDFSRPPPTLLS